MNGVEVHPAEKEYESKDSKEEIITTPSQAESEGTIARLNSKESLSAYFTILAAAFGLISDGCTLMGAIQVIFGTIYPKEYTSSVSTRVSNSLLVGAIIGQIFVGLLCDRVGRKAALVFTTALIVLGATLGTAAHGAGGSPAGLFWFLTFASRLGEPLAVSVFLIALSAAGKDHLQTVWRVCFGIGIILPLTVFYFRIRMLTTMLYRKGAIKRRVPYGLVFARYWKSLIGTCGAWFPPRRSLNPQVTFPNGVFSGTIISSVIHDGDIKKTAEWQLLLSALAIPGVFVGVMLCNPIGRRNTMMIGFSGYLIFGLIIGLSYDKITKIIPLFVIFYGLMQSFGNLGPGDMLGLVSAESFATPVRGTCYGISAAVGKAGAAIGTQAFTPIQQNLGKNAYPEIPIAICGTTGIIITYFFVPDMTGVDLALEDAKFMEYLRENGWTGDVGEDGDSIDNGHGHILVEDNGK
ncbi:MFS Git1p-like glycerophosphoinositol permease [Infundibulicybe gibba]|nr:MFS Git1p-like glycerophosphoinositol permease [Infundibulicybe gibba]